MFSSQMNAHSNLKKTVDYLMPHIVFVRLEER